MASIEEYTHWLGMGLQIELICDTNGHYKFYDVRVVLNNMIESNLQDEYQPVYRVITRWGRIGNVGSVQTGGPHTYIDSAIREAITVIQSKLGKGYRMHTYSPPTDRAIPNIEVEEKINEMANKEEDSGSGFYADSGFSRFLNIARANEKK